MGQGNERFLFVRQVQNINKEGYIQTSWEQLIYYTEGQERYLVRGKGG